MTFWTNFSINRDRSPFPGENRRRVGFFLAALIILVACGLGGVSSAAARAAIAAVPTGQMGTRTFPIAVLPLENLSGGQAPLEKIRKALIKRLRNRGIEVVDEGALEGFMARHRLRYTGGIDGETAKTFRKELGVHWLLITDLELYLPEYPPKFAIISRLTETGPGEPTISWSDSEAMAGDDSPGWLNLGLVRDINILQERALEGLVASLADHLAGHGREEQEDPRFRPRSFYRSRLFKPGKEYRVAVLSFINESQRRNAGDLMALQFVQELQKAGNFKIIDPGVIRNQFLHYRVIIPHGASLATADLIFHELRVDLLVTGKVMEYADYRQGGGVPVVWFSTQVLNRQNREVVWASQSSERGDKGVVFFGAGRISTAHDLAKKMVHETVRMINVPGNPGRWQGDERPWER